MNNLIVNRQSNKSSILLILIFSLMICFCCCKKTATEQHPSQLNFTALPLKNLSEYGFFKGVINNLTPNEGVLLYEPISPLFTDYAFKKRFVWMPKGVAATFDPNQADKALDFPDKSILIKNFYYPEDFAQPDAKKRIIETRLLIKNNGEWAAYAYRWNDEQTEAAYKITGDLIDVDWKDEVGTAHHIKYAMPNKNQCKSCHSRDSKFTPIGVKLKQLNHSLTYTDGAENQLDRWVKMGYLKGNIEKDKIDNLVSMKDPHATLEQKARSYLDVNCGHCHNEKGPASTSGLRLNIEEKDPYHWGVKKSPVAAGIGAGSFLYDIYPSKGDESIITYRMNSINPGIMMPEIGRVSIHKEGVDLMRDWINSLK